MAKYELLSEKVIEKKISGLQFGIFSSSDVLKQSCCAINLPSLYKINSRDPQPHGVLDERLGTTSKTGLCNACGQDRIKCPGHWGHITLALPVFHLGFIKHCVVILQSICKSCSRILISDEDHKYFSDRINSYLKDRLTRMAIIRQIRNKCSKVTICPHCFKHNGPVRKLPKVFRFIHNPYKNKENSIEYQQWLMEFENAIHENAEIEPLLSSSFQDLNPLIVYQLFCAIRNQDLPLLDMNCGRPEDLIIQHLPVPPVCIRPSIPMGAEGSNEDDLSIKLADIIYSNSLLKRAFDTGSIMSGKVFEHWESLQIEVAQYFNTDIPGFPRTALSKRKQIRAFTQRLKGKQGRFRGNLSGKRVDFSSRTVISPDPNLSISEVGVPLALSKILTIPERVTIHNIEHLKKIILRGPDVKNGANYVITPDGQKKFLKYAFKEEIAQQIRPGYIVERHLSDGDVVLFNRQPSLHRQSIMSHTVKIHDVRTFRFNTCVCAPYNADFDGDEMNLHVPQTEDARIEAKILMSVPSNIVTPKNGEPLVVPAQDFVTAAFILTQKDCFLTKSETMQLVTMYSDGLEQIILPPPAILAPIQYYTGKQVFSLMLKPNSDPIWPSIFLELSAKNYSGKDTFFCLNDGYVCIKNSTLLTGNICKATIGSSKNGFFHVIIRDYNEYLAAKIMNRLSKMLSRYLTLRGLSIGIDDVLPSQQLTQSKNILLEKSQNDCDELIEKYNKNSLQLYPGLNMEETLEAMILNRLSQIREEAGAECFKSLHRQHNSPLTMVISGAKGSKINVSQIVACVGQQAVNGKRIPNGFLNRTLPHYSYHSKTPKSKGFVSNSFYSGLTATEFFFHTMAGREGLVDTAVKTAETGYMQRRLMKTLEDLTMQYDNSVRNSEGSVIQFQYGDDGLNPSVMESSGPIDLQRTFTNILLKHSFSNDELILTPEQILTMLKAALPPEIYISTITINISTKETKNITHLDISDHVELTKEVQGVLTNISQTFANVVLNFVESLVRDLAQIQINLGFPETTDLSFLGVKCTTEQKYNLLSCFSLLIPHSVIVKFFKEISNKYFKARVPPGEAVGAVAAQSIGEPGTQMTLKTFHFAGVASMNVTLGVPRIKEIINATKSISTPIISAPLINNKNIKYAQYIKGKIERTYLKDVCKSVKSVILIDKAYISIEIDYKLIDDLQLKITLNSIIYSIINSKLKIKLRINNFELIDKNHIQVYPPDTTSEKYLFQLHYLKQSLSTVVVSGLPELSRVVIHSSTQDSFSEDSEYSLSIEGSDLLSVMGVDGINGLKTTCNHIMETINVLGVEAARSKIISEITHTMSSHGLTLDHRHCMLLADVMTFKGEILGITRFGLSKMKQSVLMLASFEQTVDHLYEAAFRGLLDPVKGVSECIITGSPISVGTGCFRLLQKIKRDDKI